MVFGVRQAKLWLACLLCALASGCREKPDQTSEEYNGASFIAKVVGFHDRQFTNAPATNLQQAFVATHWPYPERYHQYFRAYGKHAGFKSSLFEKYVFVPARFTNNSVMGEIVLLNAEAFPNRNGKLGRMIISKTDLVDTGWMVKWYPEEQVREIFRAAGQKIPDPPGPIPPPHEILPLPPPPLPARVEKYFEDIAANYGPGRAGGKPLMWITFTLVMVVVFLLSLIGWRKWR